MPRQQKTNPALDAATELPDLTAQQQKFVEGVLSGKTASDAYRAAYDCSGMQANVIWKEASLLRSSRNVSVWLAAAREACLGTATLTLDSHMRELERIREIALRSGNIGAAVAAEQTRGKVAGHHVEQVRDVTERHDTHATIYQLAEMSGVDPHVVAARYGVTLPDNGATKH